jgi:hypothetical protein
MNLKILQDENSLVILTYYVIKVQIWTARSMRRNADSAHWTFMVAFVDALFDALPAESMAALRVDERASARLETDRTTEVLTDDGLECRKGG